MWGFLALSRAAPSAARLPSADDDAARRLETLYVYATIPFTIDTNYTAASGENLTTATNLITSQLADSIETAVEDGTLEDNIRRFANHTLAQLGAGIDGDRTTSGARDSRSAGWSKRSKDVETYTEILEHAGFVDVTVERLTMGVASIVRARRPELTEAPS